MQLDGFTAVAEFGSRFEADLVAERLTADGVQATVLSDPAHQIATHIVNQPGHRVLVNDADIEDARQLLAATDGAAAVAPTVAAVGLGRRPRWFRWLAYALVLAFVVPSAVGAIIMVVNVVT